MFDNRLEAAANGFAFVLGRESSVIIIRHRQSMAFEPAAVQGRGARGGRRQNFDTIPARDRLLTRANANFFREFDVRYLT